MTKREVIAAIGLTNTASVNIYEINHGIDDEVLAGINNEEPEWCTVEYTEDDTIFHLGELELSLSDAISRTSTGSYLTP
jgi:hypothetical protein